MRATAARAAETPTVAQGRPSAKAAGKKPTIKRPEIQFGIFIVVKSCKAAMTARTGKTANSVKEIASMRRSYGFIS